MMMNPNNVRRLLCMLLAVMVMLATATWSLAESGNPFGASDEAGVSGDLFADFEMPSADPSPSPTPTVSPADLFGLSTTAPGPTIGSNPNSDPFGLGATAEPGSALPGSAIPTSIPGYNPFDPDSSASQPVVPTSMVMYVVTNFAQIRRSAVDTARVMTNVPFGQQVSVSATQNEWARVTAPNGRSGYCRLDQLSSNNPSSLSRTMYVQPNRTALYRTPQQRGGQYRWLNRGDTVTVVAITPDGLWARVSDGSNYGFIPSFALDDAPAGQGTPMWCAVGSTPIMVNPDSWRQISSLSLGQNISLVGYIENDTIAKIRSSSGYVAYCAASALSAENPLSMNTPVYTQVSGRILFNSASESARAGGIGKNARLTLLGVDSSQYWAVVRFGRKIYYTPYVLVAATRPGKGYRVVSVAEETSLYRNSSEIIGALPAGTRMYLTGISGAAAKVTTISDGVSPAQTGYVMLKSLKAE